MSKSYQRDLEGVADIVWDMVEKLASGDKDFDIKRAELVIKGGETIVKAKMAKIASEIHDQKMLAKGMKVIEGTHAKEEQAGKPDERGGAGEGQGAESGQREEV